MKHFLGDVCQTSVVESGVQRRIPKKNLAVIIKRSRIRSKSEISGKSANGIRKTPSFKFSRGLIFENLGKVFIKLTKFFENIGKKLNFS